MENAGIKRFFEEVTRLQGQVIESQMQVLGQVAGLMADVVRRDGRIFIFGTGHAHMLGEEAYFRAGGLAAAVPLFSPQILMLHESARLSSQLERMAELATPLLDEYDPQPGEILIVNADSGVNALPVQIAIEAKGRGLVTVGVCSFKYTHIAPLSAVRKRLNEVVDYAIDNGGTPGDALVEVEGHPWRVAASSTLTGAMIWNCLLTEAAFRLAETGIELPVFASYNMPGAAEHNQMILRKWSKINPHLPERSLKPWQLKE
jgi:uncharacterized phosphosugar-binding protein